MTMFWFVCSLDFLQGCSWRIGKPSSCATGNLLNRRCSKFGSRVEVESTYWGVVKLFNTQNKLMNVHQLDISKILLASISNLVSFIFIKSRHFTEAYLVLLHKTSHTSCILFFFWFPHAGSRESTPSVSSWYYYYGRVTAIRKSYRIKECMIKKEKNGDNCKLFQNLRDSKVKIPQSFIF